MALHILMEDQMRKALFVFIVVSAAWLPLSAYADCVFRGQSYAAGSRVNGLTCQSDGTWR
jgi:hypothetical protein